MLRWCKNAESSRVSDLREKSAMHACEDVSSCSQVSDSFVWGCNLNHSVYPLSRRCRVEGTEKGKRRGGGTEEKHRSEAQERSDFHVERGWSHLDHVRGPFCVLGFLNLDVWLRLQKSFLKLCSRFRRCEVFFSADCCPLLCGVGRFLEMCFGVTGFSNFGGVVWGCAGVLRCQV